MPGYSGGYAGSSSTNIESFRENSATTVAGAEGYRPSSEIKMHLVAYRLRKDIEAVVHAHPPYATAFALAGIPLTPCILPEIVATLGAVPLAEYATPSTDEVPQSIEGIIPKADALLLANHGVLAVGRTIEEAFMRLEMVEHLAKVYFLSLQLGNVRYLSREEVGKLIKVRDSLNPGSRWWPCEVCETKTNKD